MIYFILVGLLAIVAWNGWCAFQTFAQYRTQSTLRATFRTVGVWGLLVSLGFLLMLFLASGDFGLWEDKGRVVEIVIPLVMGIQAAVLFSPADESALEILLTYPRPVVWILAERLGLAFIFQVAAAIAGILISFLFFEDQMIGLALIRWVPPTLLLMGVGAYTTLKSRVLAFGVAIAALVWFVGLFFGPLLLPGMPIIFPLNHVQPYLWSVNLYLLPQDLGWEDYWVNRALVSLIGWFLISRAGAYLRDEEIVLLGATSKARTRNAISQTGEGL
ncbi:MAG: hypothetical protein F9K46_00185 [Anaerolineae bacterium]|nr:MAG: hypothetical protein F9K46_00185 [Anaerolineae bacterium]